MHLGMRDHSPPQCPPPNRLFMVLVSGRLLPLLCPAAKDMVMNLVTHRERNMQGVGTSREETCLPKVLLCDISADNHNYNSTHVMSFPRAVC
mmetsp:Transcript_46987/g.84166  ORF Transcript_46987/g.84166 Transcript_46987/m.84166 type:complete len:92 (-) Transcript_46987:199-474(-)